MVLDETGAGRDNSHQLTDEIAHLRAEMGNSRLRRSGRVLLTVGFG